MCHYKPKYFWGTSSNLITERIMMKSWPKGSKWDYPFISATLDISFNSIIPTIRRVSSRTHSSMKYFPGYLLIKIGSLNIPKIMKPRNPNNFPKSTKCQISLTFGSENILMQIFSHRIFVFGHPSHYLEIPNKCMFDVDTGPSISILHFASGFRFIARGFML